MPDCLTCQANRDEISVPGGAICQRDGWRVEHACEPIPMVGWLILKPLRHVESLAELDEVEASAMGSLTREVNVIPRFESTHPYHRGPSVFERLRVALATNENLGDPDEAGRVAILLREVLAR
jgi:hypothetical protein